MNQAHLFAQPVRYPCVFSDCGRYRYLLQSLGLGGAGACLWILANPSIANQQKLDPTLRRCERYTREWGFDAMHVVNARAWISTDPNGVPDDPLAIGPLNDERIVYESARADMVVVGWGELGGARGPTVLRLLRDVGVRPHALKLTKAGNPWHPVRLRADLKPFPMEAA